MSVATSHCAHQGSHLVDINSVEENEFVKNFVPPYVSRVYLGYNKIQQEGYFVWDHSLSPGQFMNWSPGQPGDEADKDCTVMERDHGGEWTVVECWDAYSFVCKTQGESFNCRAFGKKIHLQLIVLTLKMKQQKTATVEHFVQ